MSREHPQLEFQGDRATLLRLAADVRGYSLDEKPYGILGVWLKLDGGDVCGIAPFNKDLEYMFEVSTLLIVSHTEIAERSARWKVSATAKLLNELWGPDAESPLPPESFCAWPLNRWTTSVLRRKEFTADGDFSDVPPNHVPDEAIATCDVEVGLLFKDGEAGLLIAANGPWDLIVTSDPEKIATFVRDCTETRLERPIE